jgi:hypothetical protein
VDAASLSGLEARRLILPPREGVSAPDIMMWSAVGRYMCMYIRQGSKLRDLGV